jgi:hypothetical protein
MRNDDEVQRAARAILAGVAPEREEELEQLWTRYLPLFSLIENSGDEGLFVMQGGRYRDVWFNHRAMRVFWVASFTAWEGYRAGAETEDEENIDFSRFSGMVDCLFHILKAEYPEAVPLPAGVPEPGVYPDAKEHRQQRAAAEFATFAVGWAFLHEIRHLQHQQEGTGAAVDAPPDKYHAEEFSCDEFATRFMLERMHAYAADEKVPGELVRQKREIGIYFALFAMTLISRDKWAQSDTHPSMQERINRVMQLMKSSGLGRSDVVAHGAFAALWMRWPHVPGPFKRSAQ